MCWRQNDPSNQLPWQRATRGREAGRQAGGGGVRGGGEAARGAVQRWGWDVAAPNADGLEEVGFSREEQQHGVCQHGHSYGSKMSPVY